MIVDEKALLPEEKRLIVEELQDVQAHWEDFVSSGVYEEGVEKEEMIKKIDMIDTIIGKIL